MSVQEKLAKRVQYLQGLLIDLELDLELAVIQEWVLADVNETDSASLTTAVEQIRHMLSKREAQLASVQYQ
ncbi:MAG: hypothetical protein ACOYBP_09085 [Microbacteriaceae bacterium]